jgi:hypothetical protein
MADEEKKEAEPLYYMLLVPKHGGCEILEYPTSKDMIKRLTAQLADKAAGSFEGEIFLFYGRQIEYSQPIMSYRVNDPKMGELSVSEGAKGKYLGLTPETLEEAP